MLPVSDAAMRSMRAGVIALAESETHPYVRELTRRCDVSVSPKAGKTWGDVASTADLDLSASMRE